VQNVSVSSQNPDIPFTPHGMLREVLSLNWSWKGRMREDPMKACMLIAISMLFVSCASTRANLEKAQNPERKIANTPNMGQVGQFNMGTLSH
jgi:hypothetical protein